MGGVNGVLSSSAPLETSRPTVEQSIPRSSTDSTICSVCWNTYQRSRIAPLTCNHCFLPFCNDCMDEHREELPQNITQLSQQLHRLEELFAVKQVMVHEECTKSTSEMTQSIKKYQNDLLETLQTVTLGIENSKQEAKMYLSKIELQLQTIEKDIHNLADAPFYQPDRMEALLNQLNQLQEQLETYEPIKDSQLEVALPKFTLKFQSVPKTTTDTLHFTEPQSGDSRNTMGRRANRLRSTHPYSKVSNKTPKKD